MIKKKTKKQKNKNKKPQKTRTRNELHQPNKRWQQKTRD